MKKVGQTFELSQRALYFELIQVELIRWKED